MVRLGCRNTLLGSENLVSMILSLLPETEETVCRLGRGSVCWLEMQEISDIKEIMSLKLILALTGWST